MGGSRKKGRERGRVGKEEQEKQKYEEGKGRMKTGERRKRRWK